MSDVLEKYECLNDPNKRIYLIFAELDNVVVHYTDVNSGMQQKQIKIGKTLLQIDNTTGRIINWKEIKL